MKQAQSMPGLRPGVSTSESARIRELERENAQLPRANAILRTASAFSRWSLREAFLWAEQRIVSGKTATVKLFGSTYNVHPVLAGRRAELVFDPFDLATRGPLERHAALAGRPAAHRPPHHSRARTETSGAAPQPTGVDYFAVIAAGHQAVQRQKINYRALGSNQSGAGKQES